MQICEKLYRLSFLHIIPIHIQINYKSSLCQVLQRDLLPYCLTTVCNIKVVMPLVFTYLGVGKLKTQSELVPIYT